MQKINVGRVFAGGLLAGLVINISETILNGFVLAAQFEAVLKERNLPPMEPRAIVSFVVMCFGLGIATTWLYAAIRPRFGAGVPTAILTGAVVWFFAYLYPGIVDVVLQLFPTDLTVIALTWGLVEVVLGAIAGAWVYRE